MMPAYPKTILSVKLNGVWTPITSDVIEQIRVFVGIPEIGPIDLLAETGTMKFSLKNLNNQYSPGSLTPLSGWKKGIDVKLEFTYDNKTYIRFYGSIADFNFDHSDTTRRKKIDVTAVDWMNRASKFPLNYPPIEVEERSDEYVQAMLDMMPVPPLNTDFATGLTRYPVLFDTVSDFTYMLNELQKVCLSEAAHIYLRRDKIFGETLVVENTDSRYNADYTTIPLASVDSGFLELDPGLGDEGLLLLEQDYDFGFLILDEVEVYESINNAIGYETSYGDKIINDIRFRYIPRVYFINDGDVGVVYASERLLGESNQYRNMLYFSAGETKTISGKYRNENRYDPGLSYFNGAGDEADTKIGQPFPDSVDKSMLTTPSVFDPGAADIGANFVVVSFSAYMDHFTMTLRNDNVTGGYAFLALIVDVGVPMVICQPEVQLRLTDLSSVDENDHQPIQFDQVLQITPDVGYTFANSILEYYKDPRTTLRRLNDIANATPHKMMAFLNLDIGDLFHAEDETKGLDGDFFIQNIEFTVDPPMEIINYSLGVIEKFPKVPYVILSMGTVVTGSTLAGTTINLSHTILSTATDTLIVVSVSLRGSESVTSVVRGVQSFSIWESQEFGSGSGDPRTEIWYLVNPLPGTTNIVITFNSATFGEAASIDFQGADQVEPLGPAEVNVGTGGTPLVSVVSEIGDIVIDAITVNTGAITPDSTQTSRWNVTSDLAWRGGGSSEPGATSLVPMSWAVAGGAKWALIGVSVKKG